MWKKNSNHYDRGEGEFNMKRDGVFMTLPFLRNLEDVWLHRNINDPPSLLQSLTPVEFFFADEKKRKPLFGLYLSLSLGGSFFLGEEEGDVQSKIWSEHFPFLSPTVFQRS